MSRAQAVAACVSLRSSEPVHLDIPRLLHFIWLGPAPLPPELAACMHSFSANEALGWTVKLWTDREARELLPSMRNGAHFAAATCVGVRADLLRYELLLRFGGVYADVDYQSLRSLDEFFARCGSSQTGRCSFFCGLSNTRRDAELNNGFFGAAEGHPLLLALVLRAGSNLAALAARRAVQSQQLGALQAFLSAEDAGSLSAALGSPSSGLTAQEVLALTGPGLFSACVEEFLASDSALARELLVLPSRCLHGVPNSELVDLRDEVRVRALLAAYVDDDALAVHWWQRSWLR